MSSAVSSQVNSLSSALAPTSSYFKADGALDGSDNARAAAGSMAVAAGAGAVATGTGTVAIGNNAKASGAQGVAVGQSAAAIGAGTVAIGQGAAALGSSAVAVGQGAAASGNNSVALGAGSSDDGQPNVVSVGQTGAERRIVNVAPGVNPTDAVNLQQLNSGLNSTLAQANRYTDDQVEHVRNQAYAGTAAALAVAGLPQAFTPGRGMVSVAGGEYQGQTAAAIGVSILTPDGHWVFKAGGTVGSEGAIGVSVGVGMQW